MLHQRTPLSPGVSLTPADNAGEEGFASASRDLLFEYHVMDCGIGLDLLAFMPSVGNPDLDRAPGAGWVRRLLGF
jgi:hypothetical protein